MKAGTKFPITNFLEYPKKYNGSLFYISDVSYHEYHGDKHYSSPNDNWLLIKLY